MGAALRRHALSLRRTALARVRRGITPHESDRSSDTEAEIEVEPGGGEPGPEPWDVVPFDSWEGGGWSGVGELG